MTLLLCLPILLHSSVLQAFPVFTYNGTAESNSLATPSFAFLDADVNLPDNFMICSSTKQARFDGVSFFSIAGKDSREWLRLDFHTDSSEAKIKLAIFWGRKYHRLGAELPTPRLDFWYQICLRLDLKSGIEIAVNGVLLGSAVNENVTNIPSKLRMKIGIGFDNQRLQDSVQFQGSVANVRIFKEGNLTDISSRPCNVSQSTVILPWNPKDWKVEGSDWSLIEEADDLFCVSCDHYNLAIPSMKTPNESMDICREKLNNSIIPFPQDRENFFKYMAWHRSATGGRCSSIWTLFSDQTQEGLFLDMNNNSTVDYQPWDGVRF